MAKKTSKKPSKKPGAESKSRQKKTVDNKLLFWIFLLTVITTVCFFPMFKNTFTNWDDELYVVNNALLRGPDWSGIFTQPVVGNYHPLTIITLAINYQLNGLEPFSYIFTNLLLHVINTVLVFYFIWFISAKKIWPSFLTALLFGIHPMHVESVAWISERKDVLYTLFFLLSLIQYWRFLQTGKSARLWVSLFFFILSLLSKPAAVVLPVVLLLLDHWKGRPKNARLLIEKIPFFLAALVFGIITIRVQSHAMAELSFFSIWTRLLFACYVFMIYFFRFLIPYPLSSYHPYPLAGQLGLPIMLSPLFIVGLVFFLWYFRKNKLIVFGLLFFIANLLLVSQLVSVGLTIVSERYTYVPYIGLGFLATMLLDKYFNTSLKITGWIATALISVVLGTITFQRTKVWKDSRSLWSNVIDHYPNSSTPRTNRANYDISLAQGTKNKVQADSLYLEALEDCNVALALNPKDIPGYQNRINIFLLLNREREALADAESITKIDTGNANGYLTKGIVYSRLNKIDSALFNLNKCISLNSNSHTALSLRGGLLVDHYQKFSEALADFNKAISLQPRGEYYLNRSICYFRLGDMANAKADAQKALQLGVVIPKNYQQQLNL